MQLLGADMPVALVEEQARERQALPGRAQARRAQQLESIGEGTCAHRVTRTGVHKSRANGAILAQSAAASKEELGVRASRQLPVCSRSTSSRTVGMKPFA